MTAASDKGANQSHRDPHPSHITIVPRHASRPVDKPLANGIVGVPLDIPFRCFLCDWYGCGISNVGGSDCIEDADSCRVYACGCSDWPSGGFISIRW